MTTIPGPQFLKLYAALAGICIVMMILGLVTANGKIKRNPNILELAYAGRNRGTITATAVSLVDPPDRLAHLVRFGNHELYGSVDRHPVIERVRAWVNHPDKSRSLYDRLADDQEFDRALDDLEADMKRNNMLVNNKAPLLRITRWFWFILLAVCVLRCVVGAYRGMPYEYLAIMGFLLFLIGCWLLFRSCPTWSMKNLCKVTFRDTAPQMRALPQGSQAFALGFPLAVAVGGTSLAWALDPTFASTMQLPVTQAAFVSSAGNSSGCSSGSSCGSSGCGGGGGCGGCGGGD